jgi:hypothetical protein
MRLPNSAHTSRTWRIHEIASDFLLYDVWALPTPGGPGDFPRLVRQMTTGGPSLSGAARALWDLRWKVGALLVWDRPDAGMGHRVSTLRDRLPPDLRDGRQDRTSTCCPSGRSTCSTTSLPRRSPTAPSMGSCTWAGYPTGPAATADRWPCWSSPTAVRDGLHGRDRAVAVPDRLPRAHATDRAGVAREGSPRHGEGRTHMIRRAGRLMVSYGAAHTLGALTVEGAARHAGAWFGGELWGEDLADMSPANSALWLSVDSFGVPLIVVDPAGVRWLPAPVDCPPSAGHVTPGRVWRVSGAVTSTHIRRTSVRGEKGVRRDGAKIRADGRGIGRGRDLGPHRRLLPRPRRRAPPGPSACPPS